MKKTPHFRNVKNIHIFCKLNLRSDFRYSEGHETSNNSAESNSQTSYQILRRLRCRTHGGRYRDIVPHRPSVLVEEKSSNCRRPRHRWQLAQSQYTFSLLHGRQNQTGLLSQAWLNNCVGHYNHRYFFMYMVFIALSTLFIMIFGAEIAYKEVWLQTSDDEIYGHPVRFNDTQIIPVGRNLTLKKRTSKARITWAFVSSGFTS
ncbi:unnamed protein product, partial [Nesidiocoris tenuis]